MIESDTPKKSFSPLPDPHALNPKKNSRDLLTRFYYRRQLFSIGIALIIHLAVFLLFWKLNPMRIHELGDFSGPILVKVGRESAEENPPFPTSPPLAEPQIKEAITEEQVLEEKSPLPTKDNAETDAPLSREQTAPSPPKQELASKQSETAANSVSVPSLLSGEEFGNSYTISFEGSHSEVGRAGAYEFIRSYMPLPEELSSSLVENAQSYLGKTPDFIRAEIGIYWEDSFGTYNKRPQEKGRIPLRDRPYYWSILNHALGYDLSQSKEGGRPQRPVRVEFTVGKSQGTRGAALSDFKIISRSNNPQVDEAVVYGLSRWVYYNKTNKTIKGRISYYFDQ